ncbi:MAG: YfhO family protein [Bacteroidetes bacterium]|nr:YfhO family protein [Bacteroidota bacterium]
MEKIKPYFAQIAAVAVFIIITLFFFKPQFAGKVLKQDDIMRHRGMSKEIVDYRTQKGEEPLWTNSMFGGMPAYQISTIYWGNFVGKLDNAFKLFIPLPAGYLFLYFLGFYILLLCLNINKWLSLIGAVAYGFSSYFLIILEAGHNSKANALGYLPALIGGIILIYNKRYWLGASITMLFGAMELNCNHIQITYYGYILITFIIAGFFIKAFKEKNIKPFFVASLIAIGSILISVLPNAGNLLATQEYGKYTIRGTTDLTINAQLKSNKENTTSGLDKNYATQWSYGIDETFTFLIPDYKGGVSNAIGNLYPDALKKVNPDFKDSVARNYSYFGTQPFTSGPVYIGAIIIFLAFLGMFIIKNKLKWPIFFATLLTIALSWGHNFMGLSEFFLSHVPLYNKFRAVSMLLVVAELTLPLLAIMALDEMLKNNNWLDKINLNSIKKQVSLKKLIIISYAVVGGFCAVCYITPDLFNSFSSPSETKEMIANAIQQGNDEKQVREYFNQLTPQVEIARKEIFKSDCMRSFIFITMAFVLLFLYFNKKLKTELFIASLGIFILIDLITVDYRYVNSKSFISKEQNEQGLTELSPADEEILKDKTLDYRVLNLTSSTFNDASTSYYHKSIGGYHGAKLKRYAELIDFHIDKEIKRFYKNARYGLLSDSSKKAMMSEFGVLNMLNTRYFIIPGFNEQNQPQALKNDEANGNAWFVKNLKFVNSPDSEITGLYNINTKTQAIVNEKYKAEIGSNQNFSAEGFIKLNSYEPNHLTYQSESSKDEFAVFSEIYYAKGWNAYIDGKLMPHVNVNYVLRGMLIPQGKHSIEFKFEPQVYKTGNTIAAAGSAILLILVALGFYFDRKKLKV